MTSITMKSFIKFYHNLCIILFSAMLGTCIAELEVLSSLTLLHHFGRPDFLIRPGWELFEIQWRAAAGSIAGLIFGAFIIGKKLSPRTHVRWFVSVALIMAVATVIYFTAAYIAIRWRIVSVCLLSDLIVFCLSLAIFKIVSRYNAGDGLSIRKLLLRMIKLNQRFP